MRSWFFFLLSLGATILLTGCSDLGFYWQAVSGHMDLLNRKQDIRELLESPGTSPRIKTEAEISGERTDFCNSVKWLLRTMKVTRVTSTLGAHM